MRPATRMAGLVPATLVTLTMAGLAAATTAAEPPRAAAAGPAPSAAAGPAPSAAPAHRAPAGDGSPRRGTIRHVIEIMLENHTYGSLFPGGPPARTAGTTPVSAPPNEGNVQGGIANSRAAELGAMDYRPGQGYLMDRYTVPPYGTQAVTDFGSWADPNLQYLASSYEFADRNFQPAIGPTRPNIMMALNGTAHGWYFNRPDPHPTPWYSIFDELTQFGRTWKIYLSIPPPYFTGTRWHPLVPAGHTTDVTTTGRFFADLSSGHLPSFSFIRPGVGYSEEPREDIGEGDAWLGQLVNAVAGSRYWRSSAIFISYDEGGGFWDRLPPPVPSGYGTRTPLVIVSPWVRRGVFRQPSTNISILSFMQHLWHMPALTNLNSRQNDLAAAFDFRQRPLPRPRVPLAPHDTLGFHGPTLVSEVRTAHPHHWLRIWLDAQTGGLALDEGLSGPLLATVTPPAGVNQAPGFPVRTSLVAGRAMIRVRFPAPGYYRIQASGPGGSVGWITVVVLKPHQRPAASTAGFPRSGM